MFEIQGEREHTPALWGKCHAYADAVAVARSSTGDKGDGPHWGDPNQGVTAEILWVEEGQRLKLAQVRDVDTSKLGLPDGFDGDFVVVPEDFPDHVFLMVWSDRYEVRPAASDPREFETNNPQPAPQLAWEEFLEDKFASGEGDRDVPLKFLDQKESEK